VSAWARAWAFLRRRNARIKLQLAEGSDEALAAVLRDLNAEVSDEDWQVGGAIERTEYRVALGEARAKVVQFSGEGPLIVGDPKLVNLIRERLPA
jgi:hypothetical protein